MSAATNDPAIIRAGVAERCKALGLDRDERIRCENIALGIYWDRCRSNGWCIAAGVAEAESIARHKCNSN